MFSFSTLIELYLPGIIFC